MSSVLILALALPLVACFRGGEMEPAPSPSPPLVSVLVTEPGRGPAPAHCKESTRFSCTVAGDKVLAVCEEEGSLVYRYGPLGAIEKEYPAEGGTASWRYEEPTTVSARGNALSFDGERHSFQVVEMAGAGGPNAEANNFSGVVVSKGGDVVSTIPCVGPVESDWARIAALAGH